MSSIFELAETICANLPSPSARGYGTIRTLAKRFVHRAESAVLLRKDPRGALATLSAEWTAAINKPRRDSLSITQLRNAVDELAAQLRSLPVPDPTPHKLWTLNAAAKRRVACDTFNHKMPIAVDGTIWGDGAVVLRPVTGTGKLAAYQGRLAGPEAAAQLADGFRNVLAACDQLKPTVGVNVRLFSVWSDSAPYAAMHTIGTDLYTGIGLDTYSLLVHAGAEFWCLIDQKSFGKLLTKKPVGLQGDKPPAVVGFTENGRAVGLAMPIGGIDWRATYDRWTVAANTTNVA